MEEYAAKYQKQHRNLCGKVSLVFKAVIDFLKNFWYNINIEMRKK